MTDTKTDKDRFYNVQKEVTIQDKKYIVSELTEKEQLIYLEEIKDIIRDTIRNEAKIQKASFTDICKAITSAVNVEAIEQMEDSLEGRKLQLYHFLKKHNDIDFDEVNSWNYTTVINGIIDIVTTITNHEVAEENSDKKKENQQEH